MSDYRACTYMQSPGVQGPTLSIADGTQILQGVSNNFFWHDYLPCAMNVSDSLRHPSSF